MPRRKCYFSCRAAIIATHLRPDDLPRNQTLRDTLAETRNWWVAHGLAVFTSWALPQSLRGNYLPNDVPSSP